MKNQTIKEIYLNWRGLELIHSLKSISKIVLIALSLIFLIISAKINNYYILIASLIILFLQILSENKKEYYLKYKEIFESGTDRKKLKSNMEWLRFLETTSGLNSVQKWIFSIFFEKKFKQEKIR